jgi:hypothetical protein
VWKNRNADGWKMAFLLRCNAPNRLVSRIIVCFQYLDVISASLTAPDVSARGTALAVVLNSDLTVVTGAAAADAFVESADGKAEV